MRITVICVGKIKEKFFSGAVEEYKKRLGRYCRLDIVEVADEKTVEGASEALEEQIRAREGERILKHIREDGYVVTLEIKGEMPDSEELSEKLEQLGIGGVSHIQFIIGGSLGLSREVLEKADYRLSFSRMTFPHQLMRVILLEQIYRAYRIMRGEPYHK